MFTILPRCQTFGEGVREQGGGREGEREGEQPPEVITLKIISGPTLNENKIG